MITRAHPVSVDSTALSRGWHARLELKFQRRGAGTHLAQRRHLGPLLVQKAFYPERDPLGTLLEASGPCHVYVIHPPGGVASGDALELDAELDAGSHALLTTPAAGKFYRRGEAGMSRMSQAFRVHGAALEWLPQENIFYPHAEVELRTIVNLSAHARFIGWEIACLGLPASGQTLGGGELRLGFELWRDGHPLLLERLAVARSSLSAPWGMANHSALGTALFHPSGSRELGLANACIAASGADTTLACTLVGDVLICRAVARRTDCLKQAFAALWRELRPAVLGRDAVPPRIWAT
jgi:urease accessory protein